MLKSSRSTFIILILLTTFLAGCMGGGGSGGGGSRATGHVVGRVVNDEGIGVYGVNVSVGSPGNFSTTDHDGRYTISKVPVGTHKVTVLLPGHGASKARPAAPQSGPVDLDDKVLLTQVLQEIKQTTEDVQVTVVADHTAEAEDIMVYPLPASADSVTITATTPAVTEALQAGSEVDIDFGVAYSLASAPEALLALAISYDGVLLTSDAIEVSRGTGNHTFSLRVNVPHADYLLFELMFVDRTLHQLYYKTQNGPAIAQAHTPQAPDLEVVDVDPQYGITLEWSGGTLVNFKQFRIYRQLDNPAHYISGALLAEIQDSELTSFVDTTFDYGETYQYRIYLETENGDLHPSESIEVNTAGVSRVNVPLRVDFASMVADPVRDRVYALAGAEKQVSVISTRAHVVEDTISLGDCTPRSGAVTPDGAALFVTCRGQGKLARINLSGGAPEVSYIEGIAAPHQIVVDTTGKYLYVSGDRTNTIDVFEVDDLMKRRTMQVDLYSGYLAVTPDDSRLIVSGTSSMYSTDTSTHVYDAQDFSLLHAWPSNEYWGQSRVLGVHPTRPELYSGTQVFNLDTGYRTETTVGWVQAVDPHGEYLVAMEFSSPMHVALLRWNGMTWTRFAKITIDWSMYSPSGMTLASNGTQLLFWTPYHYNVWILDLPI